ncbi:autotransporter domain-containing protein [Ralstonia sp. NFACC01]|uniref:autotransporter domain-containing protein n=1 Tax=Ralstonia sp. NFACC01 TaxID=1566294 RepID=UPI0008F19E72|nr:autotransporter domain-containing protein [Ralstonia sp. NFACC01]SFO93616.1 autotransporter-associated beta strand repeat-containing protein [Ralstonia sp. NFACC01]
MNRVYRLVWSRTLRAPQVVSELTKASHGGVDASHDTAPARRRASIISIGVSLGLASAALPGWAATCSPSTIANCSAAGGNGIPNRSGNGGSGNGEGGGSSTLGGGSATIQVPGSPTSGGTGGTGATNDSGQGGPGGAPDVVLAGDAVVNANAQGGTGQGFDGFNFAGGGGGGGAGVYSTGTSVTVSGGVTVQGGTGGNGGAGTSGLASNGGGGGGGGAAFVIVTPAADVNNQGTLIGGNGGNGGTAGNPGGGGGGGDGLLTLGSGTQVTNIGTIVGGVGGASGGGGSTAGTSGAGVNLAAGFNVLSNVGTITGGAGNGGAAGVGVISNGDVIVNGGTISGGLYSDGVTRAAAIQFNGTNNTLQLLTGSNITGNLDVAAGAAAKITAGSAGLSLSNNVTLGDATSRVTLDATTTNLVVSGVISGAGSAAVTGSRTITLTGNNTYTGDTTITTGTLQIGNGGTTGSVAGNIVNNGTLAFNRSDAVTYAGTISGSGNLVQAGAGTLTISGTAGYAGSTTINAGTLALSGAGSIAASSGVVNNGTFDISATTSGATISALTGSGAVALGGQTLTLSNAAGTFGGVIGGAGGLTVAGGTQTLSNTNVFTGAATINAGTLALSGAGSIATSGGVVNNGTFDISGTTSGATINALTGSGAVALGSRTLNLANASGTFSGAIGGTGGLTLDGGTQTLSGVNTYSGATTVNAGTLALTGAGRLASVTTVALTGATSALDLSAGVNQTVAHLSGVTGSRVVLGGALTLADDSSQTFSGSLSGNGALIKQGTGTLTLNGVSSSFSGSTTVAGGTLAVGDAANASAVLGGNVLVSALGTLRGHGMVSGDISSSGVVAPGGSIGTLSVGGNYTQGATGTLAIEVSPTDASQLHVGGAAALGGSLAIMFDPGTYAARRYTVLSAGSGVTGRFANVSMATAGANLGTLQTSVDYGTNAVDLLLAEATGPSTPGSPTVVAPTKTSIYTALGTTALLQAQGANSALLGRLSGPQDAPGGSNDVWVTASGSSTKVGGTGNAPGFLTHAYGFLAGAEGRLGAATVGAAGGYTHTTLGEDTTGASGAIDTLRVALYGAQPMGAVNLSATVGYGLDFFSQKRPFGSVGTAEGDHLAHEFTAATQASLPMEAGGIRLAPHVGLRYAYVRGSGFGENGANGQNLQVGPDSARSLQPYVGVTLDKAFGDVRPVNVQLRLGYAHELMNAGRVVQVQSQDGTVFAAPGTDLPRSFLTTGASVTLQAAKATTVSLGVDATINTSHVSAQSAYVRVNHRF